MGKKIGCLQKSAKNHVLYQQRIGGGFDAGYRYAAAGWTDYAAGHADIGRLRRDFVRLMHGGHALAQPAGLGGHRLYGLLHD